MKLFLGLIVLVSLQGCAILRTQKSWTGEIDPTKAKVAELLTHNKPVKITFFNEYSASWPHLLSELEIDYLNAFSGSKNFALVERSYLERILYEHNLNLTGAINYQDIARLGQLAGITHIVFWSVSTYVESSTILISMKIVDVESGTILTSQWERR